jgi:hypothetical protein
MYRARQGENKSDPISTRRYQVRFLNLAFFSSVFSAPLMLATAHRASETQNVPWAQCRNSQPMLLDLRVPTIQVTHLGLSWLLLPFSMSGQ